MLIASPRITIVNSAGVPYPLAKIYTYRAGTLTPLTTYTDGTFIPTNTNPVVADASGTFPQIVIDPEDGYDLRIIAKDQNDVEISGWDIDNIRAAERNFGIILASGYIAAAGTITGDAQIQGLSISSRGAEPRYYFVETDRGSDLKMWDFDVNAGVFKLRTRTDADGLGKDVLAVTRGSTTAISSIEIGNSTDLPTTNILGSLAINSIADTIADGSFNGTLTGFTTVVTGTFYYKRRGHLVTISVRSAVTGVSNTTAMTLTGIPTSIMPSNSSTYPFVIPTPMLLDNSANLIGTVQPTSTSVLTFGTGTTGAFNNFTAANNKGVSLGWSVTFPVMG